MNLDMCRTGAPIHAKRSMTDGEDGDLLVSSPERKKTVGLIFLSSVTVPFSFMVEGVEMPLVLLSSSGDVSSILN